MPYDAIKNNLLSKEWPSLNCDSLIGKLYDKESKVNHPFRSSTRRHNLIEIHFIRLLGR